MNLSHCTISADDAPPGFWPWPAQGSALIAGVEFASAAPTRFFQRIDACPPQWGRPLWRVQINQLAAGRAAMPVFRTFYPGVEWNLRLPGARWFLSAWLKWNDPNQSNRAAGSLVPVRIEGDEVLFRVADIEPQPFLRCRVDARERNEVSASLRAQREPPQRSDPSVIALDDLFE
ncbi:MAG: hypothetical protein ACREM8_00380 [Vulcanimicrobiaceae bacterium]